jgi:large subunit ribosomal protein L14e
MIEVGRLCVKTAGRDAGNKCVIVEVVDDNFVLVDGNVRRKKCNISHLEPLAEKIKIKKGASHAEVAAEFKKLKIPMWEKKTKEEKAKPKKLRGTHKKEAALAERLEEKGKKKKKEKKAKKE